MTSVDRPNFPIGFQWRFSPRSDIWTTSLLSEPQIVDFVCLPVEASLLYGGPVSDLVNQVANTFQTSLAVGWSQFPPQSQWDSVYKDSLALLSERVDPATIYFETFRPKLTELAAFESEIRKVTDATPVLNIPLQWHGREMLWDELWLLELIKKTKMQVCLRLDQCFAGVTALEVNQRKEKIFRLVSTFKDNPLRLSEVRIPVSESEQFVWNAEIETWKEICFDEVESSSIVFVWNEPVANSHQLHTALKTAHSFRAGTDVIPRGDHVAMSTDLDQWELIFESVYPRLVQAIGWKELEPVVLKFIATLGQGEWDPHETLRRWPIFLKVSGIDKADWLDISQFDWAQFSAQFHPAEEKNEQQGLGPQELKLNPTLQIVTHKNNMSVIYRARQNRGNLVQSRELAWYEAAIIDELQETSRVELTNLVNHLIDVASPQNQKLDRSTWLKHIAEMSKSGLILFSS